MKLHPEMSQIIEDSNDPSGIGDDVEVINNNRDLPSDTKSEAIPEENQKSEESSSRSDDLPQERNGDCKYNPNNNSQPNLQSNPNHSSQTNLKSSPNHNSQPNLIPNMRKSYNINLITKSFLFKKNDEISVLNPRALLKIYGLNLEISKSQKDGLLDYAITYKGLTDLAKLNLNCVSLRSCSILLGSLWEPCPYILTPLKAPLKIALHLSHKIRHVLCEH